jgi:hypothetical protein
LQNDRVVIRSDLQSNWPFVLVMSIPWTICLVTIFAGRSGIEFVAVLAYLPVFLYWLNSFRITFFADHLIYSSAFGSRISARYTDIKYVSYRKSLNSKAPVFVFHIDTGEKGLDINAKPFSKRALSEAATLFSQYVGTQRLSPEMIEFSKSDFESLGLSWQQRSQFVARLAWILFSAAIVKAVITALWA